MELIINYIIDDGRSVMKFMDIDDLYDIANMMMDNLPIDIDYVADIKIEVKL